MVTHNDILSEIVHLASAALCADLTEVKKQALGDIAAACASILPVDFGGAKGGAAGTPRPTDDGAAKEGEELSGFSKFLTVAPGVRLARFAGADEVTFIGRRRPCGANGNRAQVYRICVDRLTRTASVWRDEAHLFTIEGGTAGPSTLEQVAVSALRRLLKRSSGHRGNGGKGKGKQE